MGITNITKNNQETKVSEKILVDSMDSSILKKKVEQKKLTAHLLSVYEMMHNQGYRVSAPYIVLSNAAFDRFSMNSLVDLFSIFGFESNCISIKENKLGNASGRILFTRDHFQLIMDWEEDMHDNSIACFVNATDTISVDLKEGLLFPTTFTKQVDAISIDVTRDYESLLKSLFKPFKLYIYTYGRPLYFIVDENKAIVYSGYVDEGSVSFTLEKDIATYPHFINMSIMLKNSQKDFDLMVKYIAEKHIDIQLFIDQITLAFNDFKAYSGMDKMQLDLQERVFLGSISLLEKRLILNKKTKGDE